VARFDVRSLSFNKRLVQVNLNAFASTKNAVAGLDELAGDSRRQRPSVEPGSTAALSPRMLAAESFEMIYFHGSLDALNRERHDS
jgi:hypothetical protein